MGSRALETLTDPLPITLQDGADTKSTSKEAHDVYWLLKQHGVALDSVSLGDEDNPDLLTISYLLGGYSFHPQTLAEAMFLCELEPFLMLSERPDLKPPTGAPTGLRNLLARFRSARYAARSTIVNNETVPPRRRHPNLDDEFIALENATSMQRSTSTLDRSSRGNLRVLRLMSEIKQLAAGTHPKYDVYVSETDLSFWKIVMSGPDDSPYAAGTWVISIHADTDYPTFAPNARFVTPPIKHPNINAHGRICHSLFDGRDWTSDTSMSTVLNTIFGLLLQAETSNPVNTTMALGYFHDQVEHADEVREHVRKYASKTRAQWRAQILSGEEDPSIGDPSDEDPSEEDPSDEDPSDEDPSDEDLSEEEDE